MNVSAKTEYACIAVLELALRHASGEPVRIRDIAEAHGVPSRFLVQILLQLKTAGLVQSLRGATGGYQLAKDPSEITLYDVMSVVDGLSSQIKSSAGRATSSTRVLLGVWRKVATQEREILADESFADLARQVQGQADPMYHI
jgi:Rrf2 family protein